MATKALQTKWIIRTKYLKIHKRRTYNAYIISRCTNAKDDLEDFPFSVKDCSRITLEVLEEIEINPVMEQWELIRELSLLDTNAETLYPMSFR